MNKIFKGHRHYVEQKEPSAYKPPQEPQVPKPSEHTGRRADGGPALAKVPSRGESSAHAELMGKMRGLRGEA